MRLDPERLAVVLVGTIKSAMSGFAERIKALEQREPIHDKDGASGTGITTAVVSADGRLMLSLTNGLVVDAGIVRGMQGETGEPGAQGERGETGQPGPAGADGKDGAEGPVGPQGERGESVQGEQGPVGEQGPEGKPGPVGPIGEKGVDGRDGRDGLPGVPGVRGEKGLDGRDGTDGLNGKDGVDGLGFDDMEPVYDDVGRLFLRFSRGELVKQFRVPGIVDRGVYKAGEVYEVGDGVSWGGDFWIAQTKTKSKPGTETGDNRTWRLAVRRGSEGKPGPEGKAGPRGERGDMGPRGPSGY